MSERVEVRATVNLPGLNVGRFALVDPDLPYIKTCLDAGLIVATGRTVKVPETPARGAVRPPAAAPATPKAEEKKPPAKRKRKKKPAETAPS